MHTAPHSRTCYPRVMRCLVTLLAVTLLPLTLLGEIKSEWTTPLPPFQIADHLYYVGSQDLSAYLITTPAGNILINANLESSPPQIRHSIEQLGFRYADTRILLNSQAHFDHMAGAAQILRETHARNMVMDGDVSVVETGGRSDFLAATGSLQTYPPAHVDRILHDGDTVTLGNITLTAHRTAGHTRGCTTWTLRVHLPGDPPTQLRNVVIVGGTGFWSDFHFVATPSQPGRPGHPASYPGIAQDFTATFVTLRQLPCDVFLGAHGMYFDMLAKLMRLPTEGPRVWLDPTGYQAYITDAQTTFETELAKQRAAAKGSF
jgi:metallo-beta-lactamase class B